MAAYDSPYAPYCPEGNGGNMDITNQDEQALLTAMVASLPIRNTALGSEDDSHVTTGYQDADVAGS